MVDWNTECNFVLLYLNGNRYLYTILDWYHSTLDSIWVTGVATFWFVIIGETFSSMRNDDVVPLAHYSEATWAFGRLKSLVTRLFNGLFGLTSTKISRLALSVGLGGGGGGGAAGQSRGEFSLQRAARNADSFLMPWRVILSSSSGDKKK